MIYLGSIPPKTAVHSFDYRARGICAQNPAVVYKVSVGEEGQQRYLDLLGRFINDQVPDAERRAAVRESLARPSLLAVTLTAKEEADVTSVSVLGPEADMGGRVRVDLTRSRTRGYAKLVTAVCAPEVDLDTAEVWAYKPSEGSQQNVLELEDRVTAEEIGSGLYAQLGMLMAVNTILLPVLHRLQER